MIEEEVLDEGQGFKEDEEMDEDITMPMEDFKFSEEYEDEDPDKDH